MRAWAPLLCSTPYKVWQSWVHSAWRRQKRFEYTHTKIEKTFALKCVTTLKRGSNLIGGGWNWWRLGRTCSAHTNSTCGTSNIYIFSLLNEGLSTEGRVDCLDSSRCYASTDITRRLFCCAYIALRAEACARQSAKVSNNFSPSLKFVVDTAVAFLPRLPYARPCLARVAISWHLATNSKVRNMMYCHMMPLLRAGCVRATTLMASVEGYKATPQSCGSPTV